MALRLLIPVILLAAVATARQGHWYNFRTTWGINPLAKTNFAQQPRTVAEAESAGFSKIGNTCDRKSAKSSATYKGIPYAPKEGDEFLILFDKNGFIAGMQSIVPVDKTLDDKYFGFTRGPMYNRDSISGKDVYLTTVYFVDPETICTTGRTQEQFDKEGTGNVLWFQNGPNPTDLHKAPLKAADTAGTPWHKHKCFLNMGDHYFQLDYNPEASCTDLFPVQLVYDHQGDNPLAAFVWQHVADLPGKRWETVNDKAINGILKTPPKCLIPLTEKPGVRTMHVYLLDYIETCLG